MEKYRKIIIAAVSFAAVLFIYSLVNYLAGTSKIQKQSLVEKQQIHDANNAQELVTVGSIGDLEPGQVTEARYSIRDPKTKEINRIFGFSKLLRQSGDSWDIEKPYMKMIEDDYSWELISDFGTVQIEMVGNQPTPKDAKLEGNVVVSLDPIGSSDARSGKIFMDDVVFNSENSQFSTDGPVRFISDDAEMVGTGMQLIYNALDQRIEFLKIIDLDFIHINDRKEPSSNNQTESKVVNAEKNQIEKAVDTDIEQNQQSKKTEKKQQKYRCVVNDNVLIKYGTQQIYSDEVTLSNILFSQKNKPQTSVKNNTSNVNNNTSKNTPSVSTQNLNSETQNENQQKQEVREIFITCDGGITLRPMDFYKNLQSNADDLQTGRTIEFKGQPVMIKQQSNSSSVEQIANCGFLKFNIDQEILDMTSYRSHKLVSLNFQQAGAKLQTQGSVHWQKRSNIAVVNGPGTIFVNAEKENANKDTKEFDTELDFMGMMKLYFADEVSNSQIPSQQKLRFVDFLGGITAKITRANPANLNADSARIIFDDDNQVAHASLEGDVNVISKQGDVSSSRAKIYFSDKSKLKRTVKYIDLLENVKANSKGNYNSTMQADFSRLHFDQSQALVKADMQGNVKLAANDKHLYTQKMEVDFDKDPNGQIYPKTAHTQSTARITSNSQENSSFWAKTIEYDFISGKAIAHGPVKFEFYTKSGNLQNDVPVVITAQGQAVFDSQNNRITFSEKVAGKVIEQKIDLTQITDFTGDGLVVDLRSRTVGKTDIKHIQLNGQRVKLKTQQIIDQEILNQVLLYCEKMDYYADSQLIIAKGSDSASEIQIDNSNAPQPDESQSKGISLDKPCYGRIMFFDTMKWYLDKNRIEADGDRKRLYAGYVPLLENGQTGETSRVYAGTIEANFVPTQEGKNQLSTLSASNGISYQDSRYQFEGGKLFYETGSSFVRITGSRGFDAMFNGVKVGLIEYNLNTGKATYELGTAPGMLY